MQPTSIPGIARSAPYCASPVTFGTPSGRTGRVPTHLNCFTVSREVMSSTATSPDYRVRLALRERYAAGAQMQARPQWVGQALAAARSRFGLDRQPMLD
jgi:hypothetical protein